MLFFILYLSEALCHFLVSSFMAQMGAWSHRPSAHSGPARAAMSVRQKVHQCWYLVSNYGQKRMPGERAEPPVSSWFPHIRWVSFPLSSSVYHPCGCSFLQWLPEAKYSQAATSVWCHLSSKEARSATLALQSTNDFTLEMKLTGGFHTMAILANLSFAQSEWKELQMPQLFWGHSMHFCALKQMYHTSVGPSHTCYFLTHAFKMSNSCPPWRRKKKAQRLANSKRFNSASPRGWLTQM